MRPTQEVAGLLAEFRKRRDKKALDAEEVDRQAQRAADLIIRFPQGPVGPEGGGHLRDAVTFLCEIASDENSAVARAGIRAIFPSLIERLNDSFDPAACDLYDRVFAQLIDHYRRLPGAKDFDDALRGFGLVTERDLLARKSQLSRLKPRISNPRPRIAKVLALSRVTIGADVAVTSVILSKLRALLPEAEFTLLGPAKLRELFGGDPRVKVREIRYERGGGALSRLMSWIAAVRGVEEEVQGLNPDEYWVVDPDSRLTQLGLLPLLRDERNYFFFESRRFRREGATRLGHLTSRWLNEILGESEETFPYLSPPAEHLRFGRAVAGKLRRGGAGRVTAVSLGVGGNQNKRLSDSFESESIRDLIVDSALALDKGATAEERDQIDRIVADLRASGRSVVEIDEGNASEILSREGIRADAVTWAGGIGAFAGLIAASDRYLGYDSAGQHIAAALGIPTRTIFVNSGSATFAERWRPYGPGPVDVFDVGASSESEVLDWLKRSR